MPKATMDWNSVETWERLVASIYATGFKPDLRAAAKFYGTTYDTLENRLRKVKKLGEQLKNGAAGGGEDSVTATPNKSTATPRKPKTPKTPKDSPLDKVVNGRVTKETPSKNKKAKRVKKEKDEGDESEEDDRHMFGYDINTPVEEDGLAAGGMQDEYGFDSSF